MHVKSSKRLIQLRLARAYIDLLCASEEDPKAQISIARIDHHEVRMLVRPPTGAGDEPLFWMELFDHGTRTSINSYACHEIADGADVFEEFQAEAELLEAGRCTPGTRPKS